MAFIVFISVFFINQPLTQVTRAVEDKSVSAPHSLIFAWPLTVQADGQSETVITIFARNVNSEALSGKPVSINTSLGTVKETAVVTDTDGKATFHVSSLGKGVAQIEAIVDNIKIPKSISVEFE